VTDKRTEGQVELRWLGRVKY